MIYKRWTKSAKDEFLSSLSAEDGDSGKLKMLRIVVMSVSCNRLMEASCCNQEDYVEIMEDLQKLTEKVENRKNSERSQPKTRNVVGDPTMVKTKGAPKKKFTKKRRCPHCCKVGYTIHTCPTLLARGGLCEVNEVSVYGSEEEEDTINGMSMGNQHDVKRSQPIPNPKVKVEENDNEDGKINKKGKFVNRQTRSDGIVAEREEDKDVIANAQRNKKSRFATPFTQCSANVPGSQPEHNDIGVLRSPQTPAFVPPLTQNSANGHGRISGELKPTYPTYYENTMENSGQFHGIQRFPMFPQFQPVQMYPSYPHPPNHHQGDHLGYYPQNFMGVLYEMHKQANVGKKDGDIGGA
ncbi:hypothetical protein SESBI_44159 [Sesbania bispinosa]|nr:hypothetical protein SESBI_44159 [Sesbania bispinosa]